MKIVEIIHLQESLHPHMIFTGAKIMYAGEEYVKLFTREGDLKILISNRTGEKMSECEDYTKSHSEE